MCTDGTDERDLQQDRGRQALWLGYCKGGGSGDWECFFAAWRGGLGVFIYRVPPAAVAHDQSARCPKAEIGDRHQPTVVAPSKITPY